MLDPLFGNKSVQRILVFLFVNKKCYGTQLHRHLKIPLTPIQKALERLEKGNIIVSYYEGKTRLYQFNPAYPLHTELEQLLKKAFTLLSPEQKKDYFVEKDEKMTLLANHQNKIHILLAFWDKLETIEKLHFHAKTKEESGWNGRGKGEVSVTKEGSTTLIFREKGSWRGKQVKDVNFSNVFRWTLDRDALMISLEHLRRGMDAPVFLFHLTPTGNHSLTSIDSHLCEDDAYFGQIHFDTHGIRLIWRVIGPKKNEQIEYYYS